MIVYIVKDKMNNQLFLPCDVSKVSDGYHTFEELYLHRCLLFANFVLCHREISFKTKLNDRGEQWDGWFICGMDTKYGQITYHLPDNYWDLLPKVAEQERNYGYDGHTSEDVANRLSALLIDFAEREENVK